MIVNRYLSLVLSAAIVAAASLAVVASGGPAWCRDAPIPEASRSQQLRVLESQMAVKPSDTNLLLQHAEILGLLLRFDEAIGDCDRVLRLDSKSRDAYLIKAQSLAGKKQYSGAVCSLDNAFKLGAPSAKQLLAKGSYLKRDGRYTEAVEIFNQVVKADPEEASAYMHRSYCYRQIYGPTERSLKDLEMVAKLKPDDADVKALIKDLRKSLDMAEEKVH